MPRTFKPQKNSQVVEFQQFFKPVQEAMIDMPKLESQGNRPLQMTFEDHLKALVYFHLEEHHSAQHLLQVLEQDDFARNQIAPEDGIKKSSFSEATNCRGLEQFFYVFENLQAQATQLLPKKHPELGTLIGIDGSLIDATLSMYWADYRKNSKKAKVHLGFDLNRAIPRKVFLSDGNGAERPFVSKIISDDQTGVTDRGYQCHKRFDQWQDDDKKFICRIKASTKKTIIKKKNLPPIALSFSMQLCCLARLASIKPKGLYALLAMRLTKSNTGSLPIATTYQPSKSPPPTSFAGISKISSPGGKDT